MPVDRPKSPNGVAWGPFVSRMVGPVLGVFGRKDRDAIVNAGDAGGGGRLTFRNGERVTFRGGGDKLVSSLHDVDEILDYLHAPTDGPAFAGDTYMMDVPGTMPCQLCDTPTRNLGTKLCDPCWELDRRVRRHPEVALKIIARIRQAAREGE